MLLGEFRDLLAAGPPDLPVYFDTTEPVGRIVSWRGVYAEASLDTGCDPRTCSDLLKEVNEVLAGDERQGWKGGDFTYCEDTPLWADPVGEYNKRVPMTAYIRDGRLVIGTAVIPDEYR